MPLDLPVGEAGNTFEETIHLISNDPDKPTTDLKIKVEYTEDALKPELADFSTTPPGFKEGVSGSAIQVIFDACAAAGQRGLEATVIIEDKNNKNVILNELMDENYHKPGAYTYYWEHEGLSVSDYGVYIKLKDLESGHEREERAGYDFEFSIKAPNAPPAFVEPKTYENNLGVVQRGETITIPYEVGDPDGDTLDINVYSNLLEHGLKLIKDTGNSGRIEWPANVSGAHSIYLTATDPSGNSAEVMFNITEIQDLNLFTISLEANSTEAGQVYGGGLYKPGEYVTVEAVPGASYKFISWTEDDVVVSTDPVYMFKAAKDRNLVANFEEVAFFDYYIEDNKVIITGFADEDLQDITIPNEIEGYPVTGIGDTAFYLKQIKNVDFPDTLTNIGTNAFRSNELTKAVIPNNVNTIGEYAFGNNDDLVEVVIPNRNTVIGEGAFSQCSPDLIIYGVPGSTANTYATANNITFKDINEYGGDIPAAKYAITVADVVGGTAVVTTDPATLAEEGAAVTVNIDGVQSGRQFKTITVIDADSNNVAITEVTAGRKYTFIMPAKSVTVNIELQDASIVVPETYSVTLNDVGSGAAGAGDYAENDTVTINAGNRAGYTFNGWTSTDVTFANANAQTTTFTMPARNVTVTATWKTVSGGGNNSGSSGGVVDSQAPAQYPVISKSESAQKANGKMILSSQQAKAGDSVFITIEPDPGYENNIPTVLDQNGNPLTVTKNSDGAYSFQMPAGGVDIDIEYTKIDYFDDVDQNDWYDEAAWFCAAHGLMEGTGEGRFDGDVDTTRAMLVAVLYRLSQSDDMPENIFADVEEGKWYTEAITWAAKNNIVSGYGNGNFGPEDILTREQMVAILHKYSKFMGYDVSKKDDLGAYHDAADISGWARAEMQWAVGNGLIVGVGNNLVSPQTGANRAQFAVIMQRYYTYFVEKTID
ncbi:MAG: Endo-1,4-beta-xylanase A precursor [Firmicutes bacterium ADurb.Bin373]|nr:MAG: Endo-1,4-beta-xylanase A precursor [Firmicutes bacterium ADurb.Bin373]